MIKHFILAIGGLLIYTTLLNAQTNGWSVQTFNPTINFYGVSFSDNKIWIAVGDSGTIIRSSDGGITWTKIGSPVVDQLRGVSFHGIIGLAVGFSGQVLRTTDSGLTWTKENRPTTRPLFAVSMGEHFAVTTGEEGGIFVSTDDGISWLPKTAGSASIFFGVSISGNTAVGVGGQAAIINSTYRGDGWVLQILGPTQSLFFYGTSLADSTTGWTVGSYTPTGSIILKTTNYGSAWTLQTAPTTDILMGVSFTNIDTGTAVGFNGTIVHTTNGGTDWVKQISGVTNSLNAVTFADSKFGIAVGDGGTILRTTTGGITSINGHDQGHFTESIDLGQNYPNPFNPRTTINYQIPESGLATIKVYNLLGEEVTTLVNENKNAGKYVTKFDASNISSGIYIYQLRVNEFLISKKMIVLK